jgi:hypothetical protein
MKISDALAGVKIIYLDTAPVIYLVDRYAQFFEGAVFSREISKIILKTI